MSAIDGGRTVAAHGPLRPIELATGAVLGAVTVGLSVIAAVVPLAAALQLIAAVPLSMLAQRFRLRALITATAAAVLVTFVAGGMVPAVSVATCGILGGIVGIVKRRNGGLLSVIFFATIGGTISGLLVIAALLILSNARELLFETMRNTAAGVERITARWTLTAGAGRGFAGLTDSFIDWWWLWTGGSMIAGFTLSAMFSWFVLSSTLDRLSWLESSDLLDLAPDQHPPAPLPVALREVSFRYPGAKADALTGINLTIRPGEFIAVVGHNGSGKSTLTRLLSGREPTGGTIERCGPAGLGRPGGTALVLQRPESQTLGVQVADDVVWGLPAGVTVDVDALLKEVGLEGLGRRETASLSGGQQQRLAVAAALARRPQLLIADEATAMVDPAGRRELLALLASLPARHQMTVVLVTHHEQDAAQADRVIHLDHGRLTTASAHWPRAHARAGLPAPSTEPLLRLSAVSHTYNPETPWATAALHDVDLTVNRGEALLVVGGNGSGKTTLAWVMAGLIKPGSGTCELDGTPVSQKIGRVALAFQHTRLQLQRRTVGAEIESWGGRATGLGAVGRALDTVGLDRALAGRSIDELSGGQAKRVVLAAIVASHPRVIIFDEPLAGLDPAGRASAIGMLGQLRKAGLTLVVISHDTAQLDTICTRAVELTHGRLATADLATLETP